MDLKFEIGDKVRTLVNKDYEGHELFSIGTEGIITDISRGKYPYEVTKENGDFWNYDEDMLELVEDKTKFFVNKLKVFKLVGEIIKETEGDDELLKDIVYYIECYRKREHLK